MEEVINNLDFAEKELLITTPVKLGTGGEPAPRDWGEMGRKQHEVWSAGEFIREGVKGWLGRRHNSGYLRPSAASQKPRLTLEESSAGVKKGFGKSRDCSNRAVGVPSTVTQRNSGGNIARRDTLGGVHIKRTTSSGRRGWRGRSEHMAGPREGKGIAKIGRNQCVHRY